MSSRPIASTEPPGKGDAGRDLTGRDLSRQDLARQLGARLRMLRKSGGWSVGRLADAAGIGKGSLSEIENGARSATLATLYALAAALELPLAALLSGRPGSRVESPGVEALLLDVSVERGWTVEVYRLRLEAGAAHRSIPHGAGVVEHLLLTSGRAEVGRLGEEVDLVAGESATWVSDVPHGYRALGPDDVDSVLVIRSPGPTGGGG